MRALKTTGIVLAVLLVPLMALRLHGMWQLAGYARPFKQMVAKGGREADFRREFGKPYEVVMAQDFERFSAHSFVPQEAVKVPYARVYMYNIEYPVCVYVYFANDGRAVATVIGLS